MLKSSLNGGSLPNWLFSSQTPIQDWLGCPSCLPYNSSTRPAQTTPFILISVAAGTCLLSRSIAATAYSCLFRICRLATDVVLLHVLWPLHRNDWCFRTVLQQRLFLWLQSSCFEQICHNIVIP
jgi:hypothetical protein